MTKEALTLALEALKQIDAAMPFPVAKLAIKKAEEALAQPEQEPVAWMHWLYGPARLFLNKDEAMMELGRLNREYPVDKDARQMKPLYTTPPQRTWVGLTKIEADKIYKDGSTFGEMMRMVEAKLKEKNT